MPLFLIESSEHENDDLLHFVGTNTAWTRDLKSALRLSDPVRGKRCWPLEYLKRISQTNTKEEFVVSRLDTDLAMSIMWI